MSHAAVMIPGLDRLGGAEQQAISLAKGLRRRNWRVSVVALSGTGGAAAKELAHAGVAFLSLQMRKGLADPRDGCASTTGLAANSPTCCTRTCRTLHGWLAGRVWQRRFHWWWTPCTAPQRAGRDGISAMPAAAGCPIT